jgi:hypothetical protein
MKRNRGNGNVLFGVFMDSDEVDEIERQQTKNEWNWI